MQTQKDTPKAQERGQNCAHTPGPWKIDEALTVSGPPNRHYLNASGNKAVAIINGASHGNARLIAAAPDLLEACDAAGLDRAHDKLSAVLENEASTLVEIQKASVFMCVCLNAHHEKRRAAIRKATGQ